MNRHYPQLLLLLLLLLALFPFLALSFYNQPYLDDYVFANLYQKLGLWASQRHLYEGWNGRVVASFILTVANPLSYKWVGGIGVPTLAIGLLTLISIWFSLRSLTKGILPARTYAVVSVSLFLVLIAAVPEIYSMLYWFSSQATHHLASLCLLLVPVAVARARASGRRWMWLSFAAGGTAIVAGSSELVVVLLGWFFVIALVLSLLRREPQNARVWGSLLLLLIGISLFDVLAPSNFNRLQQNTGTADVVSGLRKFWQPAWLVHALQLFFWKPSFFLLLVVPLVLAPLAPALVQVRPVGLRLPLVAGGALVVMGVFLGAFLMQMEVATPDIVSRCANVLVWWVLVGWLIVCWASLPTERSQLPVVPAAIRIVSGILLVCLIAAPEVRAWRELLIEAPAWAKQCQQRVELFSAPSSRGKKLSIEPIYKVQPRYVLVMGYDFATGYDAPFNRYTSTYFKLDSVRVDPAAPNAAF